MTFPDYVCHIFLLFASHPPAEGAKHLILASDVTNIRPPPNPSTPPPSSSSSTSSPSSSPPLNGKNRWVVFCGLPNWRFCNLKKENLSLGLPIHICIGQRNSLSLNLLLLVYYSRCKSCTMVQISLKMSPQPKVGLYLQKKSLSIDPNRLKTGPLSCQKVTLPSLNFHHICNLGFIFLVHSVFQDTFLAPPSPSHPSPLSQWEQSQQVKMCQTWRYEKTYTRQKLKRKRREKPWNLRNPGQNRSATLDQAVSNIIIRIPGQFLKLVKIVKDKSCS